MLECGLMEFAALLAAVEGHRSNSNEPGLQKTCWQKSGFPGADRHPSHLAFRSQPAVWMQWFNRCTSYNACCIHQGAQALCRCLHSFIINRRL
ncbi:hypothetical protein F5X97DRAFT_148183 [Nemania serpens]|nr:hypothetical protein F5X97DRAFT_148183 [Nemania serpens]